MFNKTLKTYSAKFREFHSQILKLRSTASDRHVPIYRLTILYSTRLSGSSGRSAKCLGIKLWNLSSRKLTFENFILKYYEQQVLGELRVSSKHSGVKLSSFKNSREVYSSSNKNCHSLDTWIFDRYIPNHRLPFVNRPSDRPKVFETGPRSSYSR